MRPPLLAAPTFPEEWRYTIPDGPLPDGIASANTRNPPTRRRQAALGPRIAAIAADIIDVTGDDVPDRLFPQYADASHVLADYGGINFASDVLMGRAFSQVAYSELAVGNVVNAFGLRDKNLVSLGNLLDPVAQYIIVNKSEDGSSDAIRGYVSCTAVAHLHPKF